MLLVIGKAIEKYLAVKEFLIKRLMETYTNILNAHNHSLCIYPFIFQQ
jgi:regulator of protease activity HflC (stomatin/prohibitin superfamily)